MNPILRTNHLLPLGQTDLTGPGDVARGLVLACREPGQELLLSDYLDAVLSACTTTGRVQTWADEGCWGAAMRGLGWVIAHPADVHRRNEAVRAFEKGAGRRPADSRAVMVAALGAAEVLTKRPDNPSARNLLGDAARLIGPLSSDPAWRWPEPALSSANAVVPDVLIASGSLLARQSMVGDGLTLLGWLLEQGLGDDPCEVAALADACARAHTVTGDSRWADGVALTAAWFDGHDDDHEAGCTLARLSTQQQVRSLTLSLV